MQKFYSLSKFVTAAIAAYDSGKPFNPAGCHGNGSLFTYQETDKQYSGKNVLIGSKIHAVSASALINGVNKALGQGLNVSAATARSMGFQMYVSIRGKRDVTSKAKEVTAEENIITGNQVESSPVHHCTQEVAEATLPLEDAETIVVSNNECESSQEVVNETGESPPNWDYALSLKKEESPKVKLKDYALKFGVELDLRKSFDAMMVYFQAGV